MKPTSRHRVLLCSGSLLLGSAATIAQPVAPVVPAVTPDWEVVDVVPAARRHEAPVAPPMPDVPASMVCPSSVMATMTLTIIDAQGGQRGATTVTLTRHKGVVVCDYLDRGQTWRFTQSPIDPRYVTGLLVDVRLEKMLDHTEADLADAGIAHGWIDVAGLGARPPDETSMVATGRFEERSGIRFDQYVRVQDTVHPLLELWWNAEHALPLRTRLDIGNGTIRVSELSSIRTDVRDSKVRDPSVRLTRFERMDVVDWREKYHGTHAHIPGVPCSSWAAARSSLATPAPTAATSAQPVSPASPIRDR